MKTRLLSKIITELNHRRNKKRADWNNNSKSVKPGGYAEGDVFIGVSVPEMRSIALDAYQVITKAELDWLFTSKIHEYRFVAAEALNFIYEKQTGCFTPKQAVDYLLNQIRQNNINNWDLVDDTAYSILGDYLVKKNQPNKLLVLAKQDNLWQQRTAMVATYAFIKNNQLTITYQLADFLLEHNHDLIHKAVGWMLREAGKRDRLKLKKFIIAHYNRFPRTALRYAIEHFPEKERKQFLSAKF